MQINQKVRNAGFCAGTRHPRSICPTRNAQCQKCSKIGHYAIACNSLKNSFQHSVHEFEESQENIDEIFYVGEINSTNNSWEAEIHTNDNPTTWKIDTGTEACVLLDKVLWLGNQPLRRTRHQLRGVGGVNLPVIGVFDGTLRYASKQIRKQIFVVKNKKNSLLSKSACVELGLIKLVKPDEINEVNQNQNSTNPRSDNAEESKKSSEPDFRTEFPELFSGQGKIKMDPYKITLKPNAEPYYLYTPRKIAHPLILQVKEEIEAMLKQRVVSEVTALTEWCARIVPVPKKNNRVRICVVLTNLNHAVEREIYPIKSVDYNLALLG